MKEGAKVKRFFALAIALSFFLLSMPVSVGAVADDSDDASFYLNYWVEEHTGINMKDIPVTAYGMSYADYIYRQTGYTVDYWVNNATDPYNFGENTDEYLNNTLYNDGELMKDLLSTTPITNTTSQVYGTNYNERVNSDGDINVSGSSYWNSVYNGLYSNNGYNDTFSPGTGDYSGSYNGNTFTCQFIGYTLYDDYDRVCYRAPSNVTSVFSVRWVCDVGACSINSSDSNSATMCAYLFAISVNGQSYWCDYNIYNRLKPNTFTLGSTSFDSSNNKFYGYFTGSINNDDIAVHDVSISLVGSPDSVTNNSSPVQQPYQIGYINYNGNKVPIYKDPSMNPFNINPDGTVSYDNDPTKYPIYINPDDLNPSGDLIMLQYIVNNYYGDDNNINDPFNNDPNNRLNYPDSNTKDYTNGINSIISWLKKIYTKECDVVKYLKQIAKGIPLSDEEDSEDDSDKFESFEDMLKLFNGSNNNGFKQKILGKIGYAGIIQNINNFGMALFGSRTFNEDGSVNTQFGSNSVTETPTLYYNYAGVTHNFWNDLQLINENGDLTKAKEYVRFFIIFGFFLSLFRSLPSLINNAGGILSNASLAISVDQSENSIELTELNQILADAPYPDEF